MAGSSTKKEGTRERGNTWWRPCSGIDVAQGKADSGLRGDGGPRDSGANTKKQGIGSKKHGEGKRGTKAKRWRKGEARMRHRKW